MSIETNPQTTERRDDNFGTPPQSRVEQVLMNEQIKPQSRIEKLILEGGGGGGGTSDYRQLNNKPSINGTILSGNKTSADLGLVDAENGKGLSTNDYTTAEKTKLAELTNDYTDHTNKPSINGMILVGNKTLADLGIEWVWRGTRAEYEAAKATIPPNTFVDITDEPGMDLVPTDGSTNPVESNGIFDALAGKVDKVQGKQLSTEDFTTAYKNGLSVIMASPLNHNAIFRGEDHTNKYTVEEWYDMVHSGNFNDLYLGDYRTVTITTDIMTKFTGETFEGGVDYYEMGGGTDVTARTWTLTQDTEPQSGKTYATKLTKTENVDLTIAAFDYYYNTGDAALTTHHVILIPRGAGFVTTSKMNSTNTTAGGYHGSDMHQITLPCYAKSLKAALGSHLLSHRTWLTTTVNASTPSMAGAGLMGAASASAWGTTELQLMNETQLYGTAALSSSWYDTGIAREVYPVFNYISPVHFGRYSFWLRPVASATYYAYCSSYASVGYSAATNALNVRPEILFG